MLIDLDDAALLLHTDFLVEQFQGLLSRGLGPHVCLGFVEFLLGAVR